ncbi:MAG: hypothetical protein Q9P01_05265 [Anaerolineae bacterium]|nr:hypothetical protein [Anaerolineae bacterium]MDQ7034247.1 hypothetical protein [Anaerolineae bacterium]
MVARFHEGCLHRRVDAQIEEFIFTEASIDAVKSFTSKIESLMISRENPKVARWLIDLRLSGQLPLNAVIKCVEYLEACSGSVGQSIRIAYLTDAPQAFENLFSSIHGIFDVETHVKWFNSSVSFDQRPNALDWLMAQS